MWYTEALSPTRHYICRLCATAVDSTEQLRTDFLRKLATVTGVEIPLVYKGHITPLTASKPNTYLPYAPTTSAIELPAGTSATWSFVVQPVDEYVTPLLLQICAQNIDPRVTAVLVERMPSTLWTEAQFEDSENTPFDPLGMMGPYMPTKEEVAKTAYRAHPMDKALIPDRGYGAIAYFTDTAPSYFELARKIQGLGLTYVDAGSGQTARMSGEGYKGFLFTTSGAAPTPNTIAAALGAQTVYVDRRTTGSAEQLSASGILGWGETMAQRLQNIVTGLGNTVVTLGEVVTDDLPNAGLDVVSIAKWAAIAVVVLVAGGVVLRGWDFTKSRGRNY
jgi:hypothetical protein